MNTPAFLGFLVSGQLWTKNRVKERYLPNKIFIGRDISYIDIMKLRMKKRSLVILIVLANMLSCQLGIYHAHVAAISAKIRLSNFGNRGHFLYCFLIFFLFKIQDYKKMNLQEVNVNC